MEIDAKSITINYPRRTIYIVFGYSCKLISHIKSSALHFRINEDIRKFMRTEILLCEIIK